MPIELGKFEAKITQQGVLLQWITTAEVNNNFFTILVSSDGINYRELVNIAGANNSNTITEYQYLDQESSGNTLYYKLKQTDFDGKFEYFNPIVIHFAPEIEMAIYPNPSVANQPIQFKFAEQIQGQLEIIDQTGKLIYQSIITDDHFEISIDKTGIYLVKAIINGQNITKRIIVK